jgi:hypothetical protein
MILLLNQKKGRTIIEQAPTFKSASDVIIENARKGISYIFVLLVLLQGTKANNFIFFLPFCVKWCKTPCSGVLLSYFFSSHRYSYLVFEK